MKRLPHVTVIEYEMNPELAERKGFVFGGKGSKKLATKKALLKGMKVNLKFHKEQAAYYKKKMKEHRNLA